MLPTYEKIKLDQRVKAKGRYNLIRTEINNLEKKLMNLLKLLNHFLRVILHLLQMIQNNFILKKYQWW
ncbi:hypothetical protein ASJ82_08170 [Methanosphaera cuniculi]|uniref:Uncharacterized protein n=1 Tax=Methanosphaera cuniculi TaxID=1077256 RepID=A0A2A2HDZ2_9EURY|nr:hypothetical protein ASJ82_08170 [Methanosphaera cuniculi]PWL08033.1 hypothetical protein MSCUN_09640 [Methanosphaera cuniculi]